MTIGARMYGSTIGIVKRWQVPVAVRISSAATLKTNPAAAPISDPIAPTASPSRATEFRSEIDVAPTRRISAIDFRLPAITVAKVLVVTIDPT